jgi:hypothetical protein
VHGGRGRFLEPGGRAEVGQVLVVADGAAPGVHGYALAECGEPVVVHGTVSAAICVSLAGSSCHRLLASSPACHASVWSADRVSPEPGIGGLSPSLSAYSGWT